MQPADLTIVAALETAGTFTGAARLLGVAHTTVSRKLKDLEAHYGARLADRRDDGVILTAEGERLLESARRIEAELAGLERDITGRDHRLTGHIKLTTVDALAWLYMPVLGRFRARHPQIDLALEVGSELRNLSRREAEVALRATNAPDDHLYGREVGQLEFFAYARADIAGDDMMPWLEYGNRDCSQPASRWLRRHHPSVRPEASVPTPLMMHRAVESGLGAGLVPSALAEQSPGLVRLSDAPAFAISIWLLTPMELRQTARIRALFEAFSEEARP
ncbi:LysR family transcriptional regulator [Devosia sp. XJ19-1]|uniref:LysR family transcriptional regulator n=1 Tax=Devosia ureilytica TaxID=2952754 RepID=A0A9Q4AP55_9HYPH|nr:LysR family transcriptional regulator [Devosia ureilytica]MCP8884186.1 LysR family transcriptional regulator [Devosia ureilytica]MCP8887794.1 LysR family transcriptional regulator [Devosia ureilytica]